MAFTDVEVQEAHAAISTTATGDDLFRLGLIYSTEVEDRGPNFVEAHKWFNLATMLGSQPAKAYREELGLEMSQNDLSLALKAARGWLRENKSLMTTAFA